MTNSHSAVSVIASVARPGEELSEQQRVAIDRLRQQAAHRAAVELAVDAVEAERDGDDRDEEAEKGDERRQRRLGGGEQAQEDERVLADDAAHFADRRVDRAGAGDEHQQLQQPHAHAGEVVGQLLHHHHAGAGEGEAVTPHRAPPRNSAHRLPRGWRGRPRCSSARRPPRRSPAPPRRARRRSLRRGTRPPPRSPA